MDFDRKELSEKLVRDFMDEDIGAQSAKSSRTVKIFVPLIALAVTCFIAYAWYSDKIAISKNDGAEIPLIKADKSPVREKPENPGGMYIANRDKKIYETISSDKTSELPKVIRLLPTPEEPLERDIVIKEKETAEQLIEKEDLEDLLGKIDASKEPEKKQIKTAKKPELKIVKTTELMANDVKEEPKEKLEQLTVDDIKIAPKPTKKVLPKKEIKTLSGTLIQLGSFKSNADAQKSWKTLQSKHSSILKTLSSSTEKADLGKRGIFYRLQAGPFKNESEARSVCDKLKKKKQGCFVVKK